MQRLNKCSLRKKSLDESLKPIEFDMVSYMSMKKIVTPEDCEDGKGTLYTGYDGEPCEYCEQSEIVVSLESEVFDNITEVYSWKRWDTSKRYSMHEEDIVFGRLDSSSGGRYFVIQRIYNILLDDETWTQLIHTSESALVLITKFELQFRNGDLKGVLKVSELGVYCYVGGRDYHPECDCDCCYGLRLKEVGQAFYQ